MTTTPSVGHSERTIFARILMACTGIITLLSGLLILGVTIARVINPGPHGFQVSRLVALIFTFGFLLSFLLSGICWIINAMSKRLWNLIS